MNSKRVWVSLLILIVTISINCSKDALESSVSLDHSTAGLVTTEMPRICTELTVDDHARAFGSTSGFWRKNRLRVRFMGGSEYVRNKVRQYAVQWSNYADIAFEFVDSEPSDIRISFDSKSGSWSYIGRTNSYISSRQPTMNFGWFNIRTRDMEFRRTTLHEFGHAIGLSHEHQHPKVSINWNREAVYSYYARTQNWSRADVDGNIFKKYSSNQTNYSDYDPNSIMHYYIPRSLVIGNWTPRSNKNVSAKDIAFIGKIYPGENDEEPDVKSVCSCPDTLEVFACEDFEDLDQATFDDAEEWARWSSESGSAELQRYSWGRILKMRYDANKNPDVLYQPGLLNTGKYVIRWDMYVGASNTAYFNVQKMKEPGAEFGAQFFFNQDGSARMEINNREIEFIYDQNKWNGLELAMDFENNQMTFSFAGESVVSWPLQWTARGDSGSKQFGGLNFYAIDTDAKFWLDNFCVSEISAIVSIDQPFARIRSGGIKSNKPSS